jgi:16S rRNA (guanine(527)-N(7))-methyltransferase RsmG
VKEHDISCFRNDALWRIFVQQFKLNDKQLAQYKLYMQLLCIWNKKFNLTAITDPSAIVNEHFCDSLMASYFINFLSLHMIADVGTGAGFPGLPLKILYPHLSIILIEVNQKKIAFLQEVIMQLKLEHCIIVPLDWRTFLRQTSYPVELFCARASLQPDELIRMFKPSCVYKKAHLIYWASKNWAVGKKEQTFFQKEESYVIGRKTRKIIFFSKHEE